MNSIELFRDLAKRPVEAAKNLPTLSVDGLNAHPGGHPNSIAWLLWHSGREADVQLAALSGKPELWENYRERFGLGEIGDTFGYGHTSEQAAQIKVDDQQLLIEYLEATMNAFSEYVAGLNESDFAEIIDRNWEPAVTRGVRLISIVDDAAQHIGQAAYAAGILMRS